MKKKILLMLLSVIMIFSLTACGKDVKPSKDASKFKEDYEKLNGEKTKSGSVYRTITIDENNPFVYTTMDEIMDKINNKETFIVYFGANWCPWCRSVLPTMIEVAHNKKIDTVYYVDVRPDNDENNDIRDIYSLDDNNEIYLSHEGLSSYHEFLKKADGILSEYSSHGVDVDGTKFDNVKRVGAPNFIIVKNGKPTYLTTGISENETDPYMELTDEINNDMQKSFEEFFDKYNK